MRRLRRCVVLLSAAPLLCVLPAAPATAAGVGAVGASAGWLSTQFVDNSHLPAPDGDHFDSKFGSSYFPNYGQNADVLFGLAAAKVGAAKAKVALDYLDAHLDDYADPSGAFGGPFDGSVAKLALARIVAGTSADTLLTMLKSDECPTGSSTCTPGAPANIFASASASFVILAEARAGGSFAPSADAVTYFLSLQCASGGFTTGTNACGSGDADIDATSYALMALQALGGHDTQVNDAADWLAAQQNAAGYWISQGIPNTDSTGLAAAALSGVGRDVSTARSWLLDEQVGAGEPGAGALKYGGTFTATTTSATSTNVLATAQGILGLVEDGSLATVTAAGSSAGVDLLPPAATSSQTSIAPGGTVPVHAAGFAAGELVTAALNPAGQRAVGSAVGRGQLVDPDGAVEVSIHVPDSTDPGRWEGLLIGESSHLVAVVPLTVTGSATSPVPPSSTPPPLANTGTHSSGLLTVGLASVIAGAGLVAVARQRRRGRHAA